MFQDSDGNLEGVESMTESVSGVFVPVEVLAREQKTSAEDVVERIQNGALIGRKQSDGWHVMVRAPASSMPPAAVDGLGEGALAQTTPRHRQPGPGAPRPAPDGARQSDHAQRMVNPQGSVRIDGITEVVIRDVEIRFSAMVVLVLKFVFACVPVGLILGGLGFGGLWLHEKFGAQVVERITALIGG
jgi:hypothetical protein